MYDLVVDVASSVRGNRMDVFGTCLILKILKFCAQVKVGQSSPSVAATLFWKHEPLLGMKW